MKKRKRVILLSVASLMVALIVLIWLSQPSGDVFLKFVGYKWQPTNKTWYAQFEATNGTHVSVHYISYTNGIPMFFYRVKKTTCWSLETMDPPASGTRFTDVRFGPGQVSAFSIPITPRVGLPQQIGLLFQDRPWPKPMAILLRDKIAEFKFSLGLPGPHKMSVPPIVWCPQVLATPPQPPGITVTNVGQ